ncbi:MAG: hypothetical protein U0798_16920 [Gemmataceae bacterium]
MFSATWPQEATERADRLRGAINRANSKQLIDDAEKAVASGRYLAAQRAIDRFKPDLADAKDVTRAANLKSTINELTPRSNRRNGCFCP